MKTSIWLFALGMLVACLAGCLVSQLVVWSWRNGHVFDGVPVPTLTRLVLLPPWWQLFCPVPWVAYAVCLVRRKDLAPGAALTFAGTVCVGVVIIASVIACAALLPYAQLISAHR